MPATATESTKARPRSVVNFEVFFLILSVAVIPLVRELYYFKNLASVCGISFTKFLTLGVAGLQWFPLLAKLPG